ncbi:unnamed protein product [Darwinula stevensoni]|uniref:Mesencephalic astrocyte-derived neurotrophic factor homolog n=1 Tax=Darwinula stevensoni TaxID=69355 RepID=A0A7R9FQ18_9CRUS|nr:unnamed protein product [Darwinula stevensoni]CAG0898441.1 unnamed protein product [Darwinula stevensoni]
MLLAYGQPSRNCRFGMNLGFGEMFLLVILLPVLSSALKADDCEVCFKVVDTFRASLSESDLKDRFKVDNKFRAWCEDSKGKDHKFCYYMGGLEESATGILGELSKPLISSLPTDKICERLKKKDGQICDLRYEKQIDLKTVDLKKLKVRDLRKILSDWDEDCDGCVEKAEYIKRIEELKPKYLREEL